MGHELVIVMLIVNTIRGSVREYSYRLVSYAEILLKFISSDLGVRPFSAKRTQGKAGMCRDETYAFVSHPGSAARFLRPKLDSVASVAACKRHSGIFRVLLFLHVIKPLEQCALVCRAPRQCPSPIMLAASR